MRHQAWKRYVARLCCDAWDLDALATDKVVERIDAMAAVGDLTDASLVRVLLGAGVSSASAYQAAPGIRLAIDA